MATRELWYAQAGPLLFDDTWVPVPPETPWYPAPYGDYPLRAALLSQVYVTDVPVNDIEVARRMDVDGTPGTILKAGANGLPADSVITEDATNITITGRNLILALTGTGNLGSAAVLLAGVFSNAFKMPTGAGAGKIIESDADGNFSWATHIVPTHNVLSASHADSLTASAILGDIIHGNVTPVWARLAGNVTTTKKFLVQTGTGAISAVPTWGTIVDGDVPATHSGSVHHAAITLSVGAEVLLGLSTQELSLDTQAANLVFAGPVSGAVATPTFRALGNADLPASLSPSITGLNLSGLTASLPIVTDASKNLASLVYTGATSFRKNLGLETSDSPTFAGLVVPGISPAANFVLTQNSVAVMTSVGAAAVVNTLYLKEGNVGIGTTNPAAKLDVNTLTNNWAGSFVSPNTAGQSYGVSVIGGTNLDDISFKVRNAAAAVYLLVRGDGQVTITSLAGSGTRHVVVDANGVLSAP